MPLPIREFRQGALLLILGLGALAACGGEDPTQQPSDAAVAEAGDSSAVDAPADAAAEAASGDLRAREVAIAAGGTVSKSAHYRIVGTIGPGAQGQVTSTSPKYRILGGVNATEAR